MRLLVTGFVSFAHHAVNPTQQIIEVLSAKTKTVPATTAAEIDWQILPVEYSKARQIVQNLGAYDFHLALGLAADRQIPTLERFALNKQEATIADNAGVQAQGTPITTGALALEPKLDINTVITQARAAGHSLDVSYSAGLYVCNTVFYTALETSRDAYFLHLPPVEKYSLAKQLSLVTWLCDNILAQLSREEQF